MKWKRRPVKQQYSVIPVGKSPLVIPISDPIVGLICVNQAKMQIHQTQGYLN
jgi:hypothetical protein